MGNNFTKEKNIASSEYHLFVVYRPEYRSQRVCNPKGVKYFHCFTKKGKKDLEGLIRRVVYNRRNEYEKAILFCKTTDKCLRKWKENAIECPQAEVDAYNARRAEKRNNP